jgi:Galactose oxidase, central domain
MDLDRIERALREGPADEPRYVPRTFGRRSPERLPWAFAAVAAVAATALVAALLIGIGLILRSPNVGPSPVPGPTHEATPEPTAHAAVWTVTGAMMEARAGHTATLLRDGTVLVAGGEPLGPTDGRFQAALNRLASAERYDPSLGSWTVTGGMIEGRSYHTATLLPDGRVLVTGGLGTDDGHATAELDSAELYDPRSGSWIATGKMIEAHSYHTATLLPDGRVLVAGGVGSSQNYASAELYDPRSGSWTATGKMIEGRSDHTATLLRDGSVLVVGGNTLASAEVYTPSSGAWTATGKMIESRSYHTATLLPDGTVLVAGGYPNGPEPLDTLSSAELYDPNSESWTAAPEMVQARDRHTAVLLPDGTVLVVGGEMRFLSFAAPPTAELYDPRSGSWTATNMTIDDLGSEHTATLLGDGTVLVTGGELGAAACELYSPGTGS